MSSFNYIECDGLIFIWIQTYTHINHLEKIKALPLKEPDLWEFLQR